MLELTTIQQIVVWIIPVLFAITLHEAAHGWTANRLGDNTAKLLGRVSFNPLRHIDLIGTIIVPLVVLMLSNFSFVFGWAKPVPINAARLNNPRRDLALVTAAGPLANLLMTFFWVLMLKVGLILNPQSGLGLFILLSARAGIIINLLLFFFNLIPIPPLDGSKIVASLLPPAQAIQYEKIEPYGFYILLILMFTGVLNSFLAAPINWTFTILNQLLKL